MPRLPFNESHHVSLGDTTMEIVVRTHPRAKRMSLRFNPVKRHAILTLPRRASLRTGLQFVEQKKHWLMARADETPLSVHFEDGAEFPVLGLLRTLTHQPGTRGIIALEGDKLIVPGAPEHLARRTKDWLKAEVLRYVTPLAHARAAELDRVVGKVRVRDMRSRWGSCSSEGFISFSWRLVFAPPEIIDYIVCHEVSHLVELNHSIRFWKTVESIYPAWKEAERWLRSHSQSLYRYGS